MAPIRFHETTTVTPEQFISRLTDFGAGRPTPRGIAAQPAPQHNKGA